MLSNPSGRVSIVVQEPATVGELDLDLLRGAWFPRKRVHSDLPVLLSVGTLDVVAGLPVVLSAHLEIARRRAERNTTHLGTQLIHVDSSSLLGRFGSGLFWSRILLGRLLVLGRRSTKHLFNIVFVVT